MESPVKTVGLPSSSVRTENSCSTHRSSSSSTSVPWTRIRSWISWFASSRRSLFDCKRKHTQLINHIFFSNFANDKPESDFGGGGGWSLLSLVPSVSVAWRTAGSSSILSNVFKLAITFVTIPITFITNPRISSYNDFLGDLFYVVRHVCANVFKTI